MALLTRKQTEICDFFFRCFFCFTNVLLVVSGLLVNCGLFLVLSDKYFFSGDQRERINYRESLHLSSNLMAHTPNSM